MLNAYFQALGSSKKILITSALQFAALPISLEIFTKIGNVYNVWYAFVITELLVLLISVIIMK